MQWIELIIPNEKLVRIREWIDKAVPDYLATGYMSLILEREENLPGSVADRRKVHTASTSYHT